MLFRALPSEDAGARTALQEALAALAAVHAPAAAAASTAPSVYTASAPTATSPAMMQQLRQLLLGAAASDSPHARLSAVVWAGRVFPSDDVPSRYICLLGAADARPEVREEALRRLRPAGWAPPPSTPASLVSDPPAAAPAAPAAPASPAAPTAPASPAAPAPDAAAPVSPAAPSAAVLAAGARVTHTAADGRACAGVVVAVHTDAPAPYYTVRLDGAAAERETEGKMLSPLPPGLPDLLPMVRFVLLRRSGGGGGGSVANALPPISRTALDELETPPMPEAALPEAMRFLRDCLLQQAARRGLALSDHLVQEAGAPAAAGSGGGAGGGGVHELLALLESVLGREESAQEPGSWRRRRACCCSCSPRHPRRSGRGCTRRCRRCRR